jgi:hypothetical protein
MPDIATVPVVPATKSTINWVQLIGPVLSVIAVFTGVKIELTPEMLGAVVVGIQAVQSVVTAVMKTWYTRSVTPGSLK